MKKNLRWSIKIKETFNPLWIIIYRPHDLHQRTYENRRTDCQSWPVEDYDKGLTAEHFTSWRRRKEQRINPWPPIYKDRETWLRSSVKRHQSIRSQTFDWPPKIKQRSNDSCDAIRIWKKRKRAKKLWRNKNSRREHDSNNVKKYSRWK